MATTVTTRHLTDAQIAGYHRDGYVAVPSLLDAAQVAALRRVTDTFLERSRAVTRSDGTCLGRTSALRAAGCLRRGVVGR